VYFPSNQNVHFQNQFLTLDNPENWPVKQKSKKSIQYSRQKLCFEYITGASEAGGCQQPSRVTCGQCSEAFTSPWLLLRHVHDAHELPVCASDELLTLPTHHQPANGTADAGRTSDDAGTPPPIPSTDRQQTLTSDDAAPTPPDVDLRSTSPRSDDLDWPGGRVPDDTERVSPVLRPERPRTQSPAESTRLPSDKPQR